MTVFVIIWIHCQRCRRVPAFICGRPPFASAENKSSCDKNIITVTKQHCRWYKLDENRDQIWNQPIRQWFIHRLVPGGRATHCVLTRSFTNMPLVTVNSFYNESPKTCLIWFGTLARHRLRNTPDDNRYTRNSTPRAVTFRLYTWHTLACHNRTWKVVVQVPVETRDVDVAASEFAETTDFLSQVPDKKHYLAACEP